MIPIDGTTADTDTRHDTWLDGEGAPQIVEHGPWTLQLTADSVDEIRWRSTLILRAVRWVIRDHQWRTVPVRLTHRPVTTTDDRLKLAVEGTTVDADVGMTMTGELVLDADSLRYSVTGRAEGPFSRNRVGLVVLHAPEWAGTEVSVLHPGGGQTAIVVPQAVAPHQPAVDVAGFAWRVDGLVEAELDVTGDVFETEDQRNWTDASFKTYGTPLALPIPVPVAAGEQVAHAVEVRCRSVRAEQSPAPPAGRPAESRQQAPRFPEIALSASTAPDARTASGSRVRPPVVLVELDLDAAHWPAALERAATEADALDVRLVCTDPAPIAAAVHTLAGHRVVRLGVFDRHTHVSETPLWAALTAAAQSAGLSAELVGGTRAHFTELSRNLHRLDITSAAITFSLTPQMHDRSRRQVIESLGVHGLVARQAVAMAGGAPVHIGPVTLRPRFNAVATSPPAPGEVPDLGGGYGAELVPDATDPRQASIGGAAWYLAAAMALAVDGVASLTLCETWGPRGLRPADGGDPYPVAQAVGWLLDLAGAPVADASVDSGARVLVSRRGAEITVLAVHLGNEDRDIDLDLGGAVRGSTEVLGAIEGSGAQAADGRLHLHVPATGAVRWTGRVVEVEPAG